MSKVIIIMGSKADLDWAQKISDGLKNFDVESELKVASAHKVPLECYNIIKEEEKNNPVFITIAGMSNALSGFSDAQTHCPVIACPPSSSSFGGADIYSSLRMPSGVAPLVILSPTNAALAAAKILGISNEKVQKKVVEFQEKQRQKLKEDNASLT
ncbi:5-(carboxyamino)imidazole ribonucleotide mutase [Marinilabilia rubra]|uniref:N5-carboxyaminoimidazole ribonucleotide mutase n=1 Tax=Marinilabilia rubra TaxID=2162893 RepID=A0A2U2BAZ8_9BACT|nr:5-(carboxyamino)imidazole ribonucleotide mutase [Marinilabilia rubra]PWE00213.1 5-(carboxyamino)imidazole ribonucleotide mutase [Marinilabilia rubra]